MPAASLKTLDDVRAALDQRGLAVGAISTRVILRTGASLRDPKPHHNDDPAVVTKVLAVLAEMGYAL